MTSHQFCPNCWKEISTGAKSCPLCDYSIAEHESLSYEKKLICALRHPVRENKMMAIQVLGELQSRKALPMFASILETEEDFYVIREIIIALKNINTDEALNIISELRKHKSNLVRKTVKELSKQ